VSIGGVDWLVRMWVWVLMPQGVFLRGLGRRWLSLRCSSLSRRVVVEVGEAGKRNGNGLVDDVYELYDDMYIGGYVALYCIAN